MNYAHYCLGFPPYRTGGLTKFCFDLANFQSKNANVYVIWPGRIRLTDKRVKIDISKKLDLYSVEIINPLPVPLCNGIKDIDLFMHKKESYPLFKGFFEAYHIDILHVHTLMGMPEDLLKAAKDVGVKILYTTHDYFGICPTTHLFFDNKICDGSFKNCALCSQNAFSNFKMFLMQSRLYRKYKNSTLIKSLRKTYRGDNEQIINELNVENNINYKILRDFYLHLLSYVNLIHFNSNLTHDVFSKYISNKKFIVQNITHLDIKDYRIKRDKELQNKIKFLFLGPEVRSKGFYDVIQSLDILWRKYKNFELIVYSRDSKFSDREYIINKGTYNYNDIFKIMNSADLLLAPSRWHETFGFVVLEAYYCGLPSLLTENVGSKDIIKNNLTGIICNEGNLLFNLERVMLKPVILKALSDNIKVCDLNYDFESMLNAIYSKI